MVVVLPWKLLAQTIILASFSGMPFFSYPHLRASFKAVSSASAPVFIGRTLSNPKSLNLLPIDNDNVLGCDHGVTFHTEDKLRTVLWQWAQDPFTPGEIALLQKAKVELSGQLGELLEPLLTHEEIEQTQRRVADLLASGTFPLPNPEWPAVPWPAF